MGSVLNKTPAIFQIDNGYTSLHNFAVQLQAKQDAFNAVVTLHELTAAFCLG